MAESEYGKKLEDAVLIYAKLKDVLILVHNFNLAFPIAEEVANRFESIEKALMADCGIRRYIF